MNATKNNCLKNQRNSVVRICNWYDKAGYKDPALSTRLRPLVHFFLFYRNNQIFPANLHIQQ